MGWNARMSTGLILRQEDGINFSGIDLHNIEELWLDGLEKASINKKMCPGFVEFLQFETAMTSGNIPQKTGEYIGWTDGNVEYILGVTVEKHNYHPKSRMK